MPIPFFDFAWRVQLNGYRWITTTPYDSPDVPPVRFLTATLPMADKEFQYTPLNDVFQNRGLGTGRFKASYDNSALFREFAQVPRTEAGILTFANRYGLLSKGIPIHVPEDPQHGGLGRFVGEHLRFWKNHIHRMQMALDVWDMLQDNNQKGLAKVIQWREWDGGVIYQSPENPNAWKLLADRNSNPIISTSRRKGDVVRPALYFLQDVISESLSMAVAPLMLFDRGYSKLHLHLRPKDLLGALWLQFAVCVEGRCGMGSVPIVESHTSSAQGAHGRIGSTMVRLVARWRTGKASKKVRRSTQYESVPNPPVVKFRGTLSGNREK
jgi:hypothetical protein